MSQEKNMSKCITKVALVEGAQVPTKARVNDVGYDLTVHSVKESERGQSSVRIYLADFGLQVQPPLGYYFELIPRSSLAWSGFIMPNSVGVIDPDYRGNLKMPLIFLGKQENAESQVRELVGAQLTGKDRD